MKGKPVAKVKNLRKTKKGLEIDLVPLVSDKEWEKIMTGYYRIMFEIWL